MSWQPLNPEGGNISARAVIRDGSRIGTFTLIEEGVTVGENCLIGHNVTIRRGVRVSNDVVIGHGSVVEEDVVIGQGTRIQSLVYLTKGTVVGRSVFIGPCVATANDKRILSHGRGGWTCEAPVIMDYARVGIRSLILPGVTIGKNAFIGAGSIVTKDIYAGEVWYGDGTAAVQRGTVPEGEMLGG